MTGQRSSFGDLVRYWRRVRAVSQLDLAVTASTTPRHMSFLETGRSQPSRDMVLRLAAALDVPLRDRNGLFVAAGFAPIYPEHDLDHPAIEQVMTALDRVLDQHAPFPAVVMNRRWDVVRVNAGASRLFGGLCAPDPVPDPANVLRLMLEPGPVRAAVENWSAVAPSLLERARREAVGGVLDVATADLVDRLRTGPDAAAFAAAPRSIAPILPVIDVRFRFHDTTLSWFSVVSTVGTPIDITAQELRLEAFFPTDDDTSARWRDQRRRRLKASTAQRDEAPLSTVTPRRASSGCATRAAPAGQDGAIVDPPASLFEIADPSGASRHRAGGPQVSIGRAPENDIVVGDEATVSRRHAELLHEGDAWAVRDVGSHNGTYVNGVRVALDDVHPITPSDVVGVGHVTVRLLPAPAGD